MNKKAQAMQMIKQWAAMRANNFSDPVHQVSVQGHS